MQLMYDYFQTETQAGKPIFLHLGWYELDLIRKEVMITFKIRRLLSLLRQTV